MASRRDMTLPAQIALITFLLPTVILSAPTTNCPVTDSHCGCAFNGTFYSLRCSAMDARNQLENVLSSATDHAVILELNSLKWDSFPIGHLQNSSLHTLIISNSSFQRFRVDSAIDSSVLQHLHHLSLENVTFLQGPDLKEFSDFKHLQVFFTYNTTLPEYLTSDFSLFMSKSLKAITISKSNVTEIADDSFGSLKNLTILRISHSKLRSFAKNALPKPSNLEQLRLDNNNIHSLPNGVFDELPKLKLVSLSNNTLSTLPQEVFGPLWRSDIHLELRDNPLKCDCRMMWIVESEMKPKDIIGQCAHPKRLFGRNLKEITAADLDC